LLDGKKKFGKKSGHPKINNGIATLSLSLYSGERRIRACLLV
jgi:hypothetical protein